MNGMVYLMVGSKLQGFPAEVDEQGRILDTAYLTCVYAGTARFDAWFRRRAEVITTCRVVRRERAA